MVCFKVSNNLMHTFVWTFSWPPRHPENEFGTVFNTPACVQFKNEKMCILGLKLVNAFTKVWIGIKFVYQSTNFDTRIKILPFLNFSWSGVLKILQNYISRCLGSREIGKTKVCIKLIETSLFTISNMVFSL